MTMSTNISSLGVLCAWEIFLQKLVILLKNQPLITINGHRKIIDELRDVVGDDSSIFAVDSTPIGTVRYFK
jgi:hypothetical protein